MQKIFLIKFLVLIFLFASNAEAHTRSYFGCVSPANSGVRARGQVEIRQENGRNEIFFSSDFQVSSGVVLDVKVCGKLDAMGQSFCLSVGELRKLKGPYYMEILRPLNFYEELRIFDLDLVRPHAFAKLELNSRSYLNCRSSQSL